MTLFRSVLSRPGMLLQLLGAAIGLVLQPAQAQRFSYDAEGPRQVQSLSFGYSQVDFRYNGDGDPSPLFDFIDPAYGAVYTRPNFSVSVALGESTPVGGESRDLQFLDAALLTWGEFHLLGGSRAAAPRLFLPVLLYSNYRRVAQRGLEDTPFDAFGVTVLGLGTGLGLTGELAGRLQLQARATPAIGLASRSFGDATGSARMLDADVQLHLGPLVGRFGLSVGYGFRAQWWNVGASNLLIRFADDFFDYRGVQHTFRAGFNW